MLTGVLNTLLTADSTDYDRKMDAAEKRPAKLKSELSKAGSDTGIGKAASAFGGLSGLADVLGGPLAKIKAIGSAIGEIISGVSSKVGVAQADLASSSLAAAGNVAGSVAKIASSTNQSSSEIISMSAAVKAATGGADLSPLAARVQGAAVGIERSAARIGGAAQTAAAGVEGSATRIGGAMRDAQGRFVSAADLSPLTAGVQNAAAAAEGSAARVGRAMGDVNTAVRAAARADISPLASSVRTAATSVEGSAMRTAASVENAAARVGGAMANVRASSAAGRVTDAFTPIASGAQAAATGIDAAASRISTSSRSASASIAALGNQAVSAAAQARGSAGGVNQLGSSAANMAGSASSTAASTGILGRAIGLLSNPVGLAIGGLAALAAVTIGVGLALHSMASHGAEAILQVRSMATEIGLTVSQMSSFSAAPQGFTEAMLHMERSIQDGSEGALRGLATLQAGAQRAGSSLNLGDLDPVRLQRMNPEQQLRSIARAFSQLQTQGERASVARAMFGRGSPEMLEFLSRGEAGIDAMQARAERFGLVLNSSQADAVKNADREWKNFGLAMDGIGRQAAVLFAPLWQSIGEIGGQVGEWLVGAFKDAQPALKEIGSLIGSFFRYITNAIPSLGIFQAAFRDMGGDGLKSTLKEVFNWIRIIAEVVGKVYNAMAEVWKIIWDKIWVGIKALVPLLLDFHTFGAFSWLKDSLGDWESVKTTAMEVLASIVVAMDEPALAWRVIQTYAEATWLAAQQAVLDWAQSSVSAVADFADGFTDLVGGALEGSGRMLASWVRAAGDGISSLAAGMGSWAEDWSKSISGALSGSARMLADWVEGFGSRFIDPLIRQVRRLIDAMDAVARLDPTGTAQRSVNLARSALDGIQNAPGGIADGLRGVADSIDQQGQNLIRGAVDGIGQGMRGAADTIEQGLAGMADGIRAANPANAIRGVAGDIGIASRDLQREIDQLMRDSNGDLANFAARVAAVVDRWRSTVQDAARDAEQQINVQPWAREHAITGHEAATADSQRAFSLQYGTRGNAEMYARQTANAVTQQLAEVARVRAAMERAPVIRRANLG